MKVKSIISAMLAAALVACLAVAYAPAAYAANASSAQVLAVGSQAAQSTTKQASSIKIEAQTKAYTGKRLAYTGKVARTGSTGKVTYKYYRDKACTKPIAAKNVKAIGTYWVRATLAADGSFRSAKSNVARFTIAKAKNPLAVHAKALGVNSKTLASKTRTVKALAVSKAKGEKSFKVVKWTTKKAKKYFTVDKRTGKTTVRKGTPAGTYKFKVKVSADGNKSYKGGSKTVTVRIGVKQSTWIEEQGHWEPVYTTVVDQEAYTTTTRVYYTHDGWSSSDRDAARAHHIEVGGHLGWDDIVEEHPAVTHQEQTGQRWVVDTPGHWE